MDTLLNIKKQSKIKYSEYATIYLRKKSMCVCLDC